MAKISEKEIAHILHNSLDLVLVLNPSDRSLMFINSNGADWLGYSVEELLSSGPFTFFPELTDGELEAILENLETLEPGEGLTLVTPVRRNLGSDHDFEFRLQLLTIEGRAYVIANGRDIAERVAVTDQMHTMLADAQNESRQDKTTRLLQRDAFLPIFREFLAQLGSDEMRLTLLVIDLKNLAEINEQFGQAIGDGVLRNMGKLLDQYAQADDICARFSGRKLCILMPNQGQHDGLLLADKINTALSKVKYNEFPTLRIHSSIAVAELPEPGDPELLLDKVVSRLRESRNLDVAHEVHRLGLLSLQLP